MKALEVCFSSLCSVESRWALIQKDRNEQSAVTFYRTCGRAQRSRGLRRKGHRGFLRVECGSEILVGAQRWMGGRLSGVGLAVEESVSETAGRRAGSG